MNCRKINGTISLATVGLIFLRRDFHGTFGKAHEISIGLSKKVHKINCFFESFFAGLLAGLRSDVKLWKLQVK